MARYIDADEALRMMRNSQQDNPCETPFKGIWNTAHECCISCVDAVPTANVAPIEDIAKEFTCVFGQPHKVTDCPIDDEIAKAKADTVRKMHSMIKERCINGGIYPAFVARTIEQVEKEMLEGANGT